MTQPIIQSGLPDENAVAQSVRTFLDGLGIDAHPELDKTPERVAEFWHRNLLSGYHQDPASILGAKLPSKGSAVVTLTGIPFHSVCPHHLVPYFGIAHLAYEPGGNIVGLGALESLVSALSRRLILQETLCDAVVDALSEHLGAQGAACSLEARHLCLMLRGREPRSTILHTRAARGTLRARPEVLPPTGAA